MGAGGEAMSEDSSVMQRAAAMGGNGGGGGWKSRLHGSQNELSVSSSGSSKYYQARGAPNESQGWRRSILASLSNEQLQAMARQEKAQQHSKPTAALSAEDAATRARMMSEQIDAITAGVRRRQAFQPVRKTEEEEKQMTPATAIDTADSGVRKRPAFQPAKIVTAGTQQLSSALPDSAFSVPIRPAFSPAQPTSPLPPTSPQSAGVDLRNLPKGRPSFTPARVSTAQ